MPGYGHAMDEAFFLRARRMLKPAPRTCPDHASFAALTVARQDSSPTAQANRRCAAAEGASDTAALASLLLAEPAWPEAAAGQAGCFNRAVAVRRVNGR